LQSISIPYVVVDNFMPHLDCNCIAINNKEISYQAVKYLAALGHQSIGYFCSDIPIQNFGERAEGFEKAIQDLELSFSPVNRIYLTPTLLGSYENMKRYLSQGHPLPTCAFADNDTIAIGAIKALKEYNYRIPQDISIIGFDNIHFAAINSPALSTMNIPKKLIGSMALKHLQLAMDDPSMKNIKTRIGGSLIIRHST
jgi:DNA-binding LacI/PurR family transcriptional regulator